MEFVSWRGRICWWIGASDGINRLQQLACTCKREAGQALSSEEALHMSTSHRRFKEKL